MGPAGASTCRSRRTPSRRFALVHERSCVGGLRRQRTCVPGRRANVVKRPAAIAPAVGGGPRSRGRSSRSVSRRSLACVPRPGGRARPTTRRCSASTRREDDVDRVPARSVRRRRRAARRSQSVSQSATAFRRGCTRTRSAQAAAPQGSRLGRPVLTVASLDLGPSTRRRARTSRFASAAGEPSWSTGARPGGVYLTPIRHRNACAHARDRGSVSVAEGIHRRPADGGRDREEHPCRGGSRPGDHGAQRAVHAAVRRHMPRRGSRRDAYDANVQADAYVHPPRRLDELQRLTRGTSASCRQAVTGEQVLSNRQDRPPRRPPANRPDRIAVRRRRGAGPVAPPRSSAGS